MTIYLMNYAQSCIYRVYHFNIYIKYRNVQKYEKMFQTKVDFGGGLRGYYWIDLASPRSDQGHFEFFKWNPLAFIAHYCSSS